jgi:hypothetical protein
MLCGISPAIVGLNPKSTHGPCDEARVWVAAIRAAVGIPITLPVYFGRRRIGWVRGDSMLSIVYWTSNANISGYDDILNANYNSRSFSYSWSKVVNLTTAGQWFDLWTSTGNPGIGTYTAAAFTSRALTNLDPGCMPWAAVSPFQRGNVNFCAGSVGGNVNSVPGMVLVYDRVLAYEAISYNANASQALVNSVPAPRYANAQQGGLQCMITVQTTIGATATTLNALVYTNQGGAGGRNVKTTPTINMLVSKAVDNGFAGQFVIAPAYNTSTVVASPFLPLQDGDQGMSSIQSFTTSAANSGTICFALVKPIAYCPVLLGGSTATYHVRDTIQQVQNLEPILDGACLSLAAQVTAVISNSGFMGEMATVWN